MLGNYEDIREPRHHPSDVRFYFALSILIIVGLAILSELGFSFSKGCQNLQSTLDSFGLFDAALFTIASAITAFYFSGQQN